MKKYSHKIIKEVIRNLLTNHPFFSSRLLTVQHLQDDSIETACTNGIYIKYNHQFVSSLTYQQRITLVAHELAHIIFMHHLRLNGRDAELWNVATDHAINLLLTQMGFAPIPNWLCDHQYAGLSAENIYEIVKKQPQQQQQQQKDRSQASGGSVEAPKGMTKEEQKKALEEGKKDLEKAIQQAQAKVNGIKKSKALRPEEKKRQLDKAGKGLHEFVSQLDEIRDSQIDWRPIVNRFLNDLQANDYNMMQPDEDFLTSCDFYMPAIESMEFGDVALVMDVSGSLASKSKQLASEVFHCLNLLGKKTLDVIYVSDHVHFMKTIEHENDIEVVNGGGTCFRGFFNHWLPNHSANYKGMIFITDGVVNTTNWNDPNCPLLWVMTRKNQGFEQRIKFGECIQMINT